MIKSLKIFHREYQIKNMTAAELANGGHYGMTNHREQLMLLDMEAKPNELADTLLHESLHAICNTMGANIKEYDEEEVITFLSHGIITMFNDNPKMLDEFKRLLK